MFAKAENLQAYLKAGIMGFAGSGKTFTAKELAIGLHTLLRERKLPGGDKPVFFLDTETGSDWVKPAFDAAGIELQVDKTRQFDRLGAAIGEVAKQNAILIIDSITHFWRELTESYEKQRNRKRGLEFQDWAYLKKRWGLFTDAFVNSTAHIILCGRAGYEYDFFTNDDGKKELEKTGVKMKAETETGYEPSILIYMEREQDISGDVVKVSRTATVLKDRSNTLDGKVFANPRFGYFLPHVQFLNLGGEQLGVDTSQASYIEPVDSAGYVARQQAEIVLDEIQAILVKHFPGQTAAEKKAKGDLLESHFRTRSWKRLETFDLNELRRGYDALKWELEHRTDADAPLILDGDAPTHVQAADVF